MKSYEFTDTAIKDFRHGIVLIDEQNFHNTIRFHFSQEADSKAFKELADKAYITSSKQSNTSSKTDDWKSELTQAISKVVEAASRS